MANDRPPFPGRVAEISHPSVNGGVVIRYAEHAGPPHSPDWNFDLQRGRITRTYIVKTPNGYVDLIAAKMLFLGGPLGWLGEPSQAVSRILPHSLPVRCTLAAGNGNYDGRYLFASEFKAHGEGYHGVDPQFDINKWDSHVVDVVYTTRPYRLIRDEDLGNVPEGNGYARFVSREVFPEVQYLSLPRHAVYRYEPIIDDTAHNRAIRLIPSGLGITVSQASVKLCWYEVPEANISSTLINPGLPFGWIDRCLGKVNQDAWNGCPPRTLLFLALHFEGPFTSALGGRTFNVHFGMSFKRQTHQTIYWPPLQNPSAVNSAPNFVPESGVRGWVLVRAGLDLSFRQNATGGREDGVYLYDEYPFERLFKPVTV